MYNCVFTVFLSLLRLWWFWFATALKKMKVSFFYVLLCSPCPVKSVLSPQIPKMKIRRRPSKMKVSFCVFLHSALGSPQVSRMKVSSMEMSFINPHGYDTPSGREGMFVRHATKSRNVFFTKLHQTSCEQAFLKVAWNPDF